tara:strand:+ start:1496 stop:2188 length:693 start_codon:yes stop_codon:yes gene_type:complete
MEFKLEQQETIKYNYLVESQGYGSDTERSTAIDRLTKSLGDVSEMYLEILNNFSNKDDLVCEVQPNKVLDIGSGPGGVMSWVGTFENVDVFGIDISDVFVSLLKKNFPDFSDKVFVCNAMDLSIFDDNSFELVQHTDGMEHIPVEWEIDCLKEAVRVSKKYVLYETAISNAFVDTYLRNDKYKYKGAHINIKTCTEWYDFYEKHADVFGYSILKFNMNKENFSIILEKNK